MTQHTDESKFWQNIGAAALAVMTAALLFLLLLLFVRNGYSEEAQQAPGSRYLILSDVTADPEFSKIVEECRKAGPVHYVIGRMYVKGGSYEHVVFLYVRDQGFQHRIQYYKTKRNQIPVVELALPGGLVDVKLAELFSEIKTKGKKK